MHNKYTTKPKSNPPQRQFAGVVATGNAFLAQMEEDGCSLKEVADIREQLELARVQVLAEFGLRSFLLKGIRLKLKFLSRLSTTEAAEALDEAENLALRLPDKRERQHVLGLLWPLRKNLRSQS